MALPADPVADASDGLVRALEDTLASKIAAGEVVQRPASAAKELVENALDAGARHVALHLKAAGSELIHVVDDGCGMGPRDALACFGRHATSKLRHIEDLERLRTLGFRGEALASIASVAQVELKTKRAQDAAGTRVVLEGGSVTEQAPCAAPDGTSLAVKNLFYNVPARRNFLKTPATEFKHLVETFQFLALSHPHVGFTLTHDGAEVYHLAAASPTGAPLKDGAEGARAEHEAEALRQRIEALFGEGEALIPVGEDTSYLSIRGFVGPVSGARRGRGQGFLFVNGRYVKSRALDHAVAAGYGDLLARGQFPFFALFLDVDPRHVDVNVHPTKTEVKFDDERGVAGFVRAVVRKAIGEAELFPQADERGAIAASMGSALLPPPAEAFGGPVRTPAGAVSSGDPPPLPDVPAGPPLPSADFAQARDVAGSGPARVRLAAGSQASEGDGAPSISVRFPAPGPAAMPELGEGLLGTDLAPSGDLPVWQLHDRYLLAPLRSGLLVVDQQAAHERVLYERYLAQIEGGLGVSQQLLFPHTVELDAADHALLEEAQAELRALGFEVELMANRTALVRGVPAEVRPGDERTLLEDVLARCRAGALPTPEERRERLAASVAQRSAIRAGQRLGPKAARRLIDELFDCASPFASPSGRATAIRIAADELDRRFGRPS